MQQTVVVEGVLETGGDNAKGIKQVSNCYLDSAPEKLGPLPTSLGGWACWIKMPGSRKGEEPPLRSCFSNVTWRRYHLQDWAQDEVASGGRAALRTFA